MPRPDDLLREAVAVADERRDYGPAGCAQRSAVLLALPVLVAALVRQAVKR
jgi:hypothetical protein